jgi:hypothetical protein
MYIYISEKRTTHLIMHTIPYSLRISTHHLHRSTPILSFRLISRTCGETERGESLLHPEQEASEVPVSDLQQRDEQQLIKHSLIGLDGIEAGE